MSHGVSPRAWKKSMSFKILIPRYTFVHRYICGPFTQLWRAHTMRTIYREYRVSYLHAVFASVNLFQFLFMFVNSSYDICCYIACQLLRLRVQQHRTLARSVRRRQVSLPSSSVCQKMKSKMIYWYICRTICRICTERHGSWTFYILSCFHKAFPAFPIK